jgi:hypothetical protein
MYAIYDTDMDGFAVIGVEGFGLVPVAENRKQLEDLMLCYNLSPSRYAIILVQLNEVG